MHRANQLIATKVEESPDTIEQHSGQRPSVVRRGQVQQKECTDNAVVKSGKLYVVQHHVNQRYEGCSPQLEGRWLEFGSNTKPR